jgi:hypothetical protein
VRWRATIRAFDFIHTAVTRLFDKTGKKGECRVSKITGYFTKWVPWVCAGKFQIWNLGLNLQIQKSKFQIQLDRDFV